MSIRSAWCSLFDMFLRQCLIVNEILSIPLTRHYLLYSFKLGFFPFIVLRDLAYLSIYICLTLLSQTLSLCFALRGFPYIGYHLRIWQELSILTITNTVGPRGRAREGRCLECPDSWPFLSQSESHGVITVSFRIARSRN